MFLKTSKFRSCGRFQLLEFKPIGMEAAAIIEFDGENEPAHKRSSLQGSVKEFDFSMLALLIDSMPAGEEREYLNIVHSAVELLADITHDVFAQFDCVTHNDIYGCTYEGDRIKEAQDVLKSLYL